MRTTIIAAWETESLRDILDRTRTILGCFRPYACRVITWHRSGDA